MDGGSRWPRAAVFDCDGLLLDTAACWRDGFERALARTGRRLGGAMLRQLNGASVRGAAALLDVPAEILHVELEAAFASGDPAPRPGASTLLGRLRGRMPLAVATNGPEALVIAALRRAGLLGGFEAVLSAESQARDKPAPDVYLAACARLGVDPSDAIAFEDSTAGAESARRAGLMVICVPSSASDRPAGDLQIPRLDDARLIGLLQLDTPYRDGVRAGSSRRGLVHRKE